MRFPSVLDLKPRRRRGTGLIISLVAVLALMGVIGLTARMIQVQSAGAGETHAVSLARMQALYLAEMGLNQLMYQANLTPAAPFPLTGVLELDFRTQVAMARATPGGVARCQLSPAGADPEADGADYRVTATLTVEAGTFERRAYFDVARASVTGAGAVAPQWVLARYRLAPEGR